MIPPSHLLKLAVCALEVPGVQTQMKINGKDSFRYKTEPTASGLESWLLRASLEKCVLQQLRYAALQFCISQY